MKKAAIYSPYWDSLGGGERYVATVAQFLLSTGWQVDIWHPQDISLQVKARFGIDISAAKYVSPQNTRNYDLLFWVSDGSLPTSFAKKTLIHFQFPLIGANQQKTKNFLKSRFYKFVVNSEFTKHVIDKEFGVNSQVAYPPVDVDYFSPGKKENIILYVGRFSNLTQLKGHPTLIQAFKELSPHAKNYRLVLAGGLGVGADMKLISQLKTKSAKLPVEFIFNPSLKELKDLYARAKFFWSASGYQPKVQAAPLLQEHFGISVVESMAAGGIPLLANLGGFPEIVEPGVSGFLWDQPSQLVSQTLKLIKSPAQAKEVSQNAVLRSKIFSVSQFTQAISQLI